ncbi:hypothetical protein Tsubulata_020266 [Turnera subulata]|uniref:CCHC-type domain-containing protein n=1 Tax=Turnera subulata TaxID=218843 RepID=A0A9Q0JPR1_9ROSI|nr:hypothetical protein Tsubulata_020266 [Turnera subulata]
MYYDDDLFDAIARGIGVPRRINSNAFSVSRALYACMCVEIDLKDALVSDVTIRDELFKVQYEGLYVICLSCGRYGHRTGVCPTPSPYGHRVTIIDPDDPGINPVGCVHMNKILEEFN